VRLVEKRRCLWLCLTLLLVALLLLPAVHWRVIGWVKGEAFYQGRPTSYWSREAGNLMQIGAMVWGSPKASVVIPQWQRQPSWIEQYLPTGIGNSSTEFALFKKDEEELPVLIELLHDPSAQVRLVAAQSLCHFGPEAEFAAERLLPLCYDQDKDVRRMARMAMRNIDIETALKVDRDEPDR
jgi:hypothetical protein